MPASWRETPSSRSPICEAPEPSYLDIYVVMSNSLGGAIGGGAWRKGLFHDGDFDFKDFLYQSCGKQKKMLNSALLYFRGYLTFQFSGRGVEVIDKMRSVPFFQAVSLGLTKKRAMSGVKKAVWDCRLKSSSKPTRSNTMSRLPFT